MDGTTEPIIVVIGHPIAGNPAQFAAERALRSLKLDWRVLSFDVKPADVAAALEGFAVTGIKGVIIDRSLAKEARQWYSRQTGSDQSVIDCLTRDVDSKLVGQYEQREWVDEQISRHGGQRLVWIGERLDSTPASGDGFQEHLTAPKNIAELAADADVIVISTSPGAPAEPGTPTEPGVPAESGAPTEPGASTDAGAAIELDADDWPVNDGSTLVIDLTEEHPEVAKIKQLGYRVLGENERRIGTLQRCLHCWTGNFPAADVIHDAIEEYLSV